MVYGFDTMVYTHSMKSSLSGFDVPRVVDENGEEWVPLRVLCAAFRLPYEPQVQKVRRMGIATRRLQVGRATGSKGWVQFCIRVKDIDQWRETLRSDGSQSQVYFIEALTTGLVRIGFTSNLSKRMKDLSVGCPVPLTLLKSLPGGASEEKALHLRFAEHRKYGEWFLLAPIRNEIEGMTSIEPVQVSRKQRVLPPKSVILTAKLRVLEALVEGPLNLSQLARKLECTIQSVIPHVRKLEELRQVTVTQVGHQKVVQITNLGITHTKYVL